MIMEVRGSLMRMGWVLGLSLVFGGNVSAAILTEDFDELGGFFAGSGVSIPSFPTVAGWEVVNTSNPVGPHSWFDAPPIFRNPFAAYSGTCYAGVEAASTTGANTISNWLLTPQISFSAGDQLSFYTRTVTGPQYPDRMQVRLSTNGASADVGTNASTVGDFSTLLLDINSGLTTSGYPSVWTQYTANMPVGGSGRLAFRYYVPNGGPLGANSDYIGLDSITVTPEPGAVGLIAVAGAWLLGRRRRVQSAI